MRNFVSLCALLALPTALYAQRTEMPPVLMAHLGEESTRLQISNVEIDVRIVGHVAETATTMTFTSSAAEDVEGDLIFPLPTGATVSGYALDIEGRMVDGVAIERHWAQRVFDRIIRRQIDPGLVEWAGNNNFKTRVYPIPARGSRTICVKYVSEIVGGRDDVATYRLPLNYEKRIKEFAVRVKVLQSPSPPRIGRGSLRGLVFRKGPDGFVAQTRLKNTAPAKDLVIALPGLSEQNVLVEEADDGQIYFCIRDVSRKEGRKPTAIGVDRPAPELLARRKVSERRDAPVPKHVVIYWDASGSRADDNHAREINAIKRYFAQVTPPESGAYPKINVDVILLRNAPSEPRRIVVWGRNPQTLVSALRSAWYDGGTQIGAIAPRPDAETPDFYILVTDGFSNYGNEMPLDLDAPAYVIASSKTANHALLHRLALATGGRYLNLAWMDNARAAAAIGQPSSGPVAADAFDDVVGDRVTDLILNSPQHAPDHVSVVGKLTADDAILVLHYDRKKDRAGTQFAKVSREDAVNGSLLRQLWAQKKLNELLSAPGRNREKIIALGKEHGFVTPYTSLIVLDSLQQYVQYRIVPPKSLPEMRRQYLVQTGEHATVHERMRKEKIDRVASMWQDRVQRWNQRGIDGKAVAGNAPVFRDRNARGVRGGGNMVGRGGFQAHGFGGLQRRTMPANPIAMGGNINMGGMGGGAGGMAGISGMGAGMGGFFAIGDGVGAGMGRVGGAIEPGSPLAGRLAFAPDMFVRPEPVVLVPMNPSAPCLKRFEQADKRRLLHTYLRYRRIYHRSPVFYLESAACFERRRMPELAAQVLSNLTEFESGNAAVLRVLGHRLVQMNRLEPAVKAFELVLQLRPDDPQAQRDLALVLAQRADQTSRALLNKNLTKKAAYRLRTQIKADYARSLKLLYDAIASTDGQSGQIELVALMEANRIVPKAKAFGVKIPHDARMVQLLDCDLRIVITPLVDGTDVDLCVLEPSGQRAYHTNGATAIGGLIGSKEYVLRNAMPGAYRIGLKPGHGRPDMLLGSAMVRVDVFTDFGRRKEQCRTTIHRLTSGTGIVAIGGVKL